MMFALLGLAVAGLLLLVWAAGRIAGIRDRQLEDQRHEAQP